MTSFADIVGGSEKVPNYADVINGWYLSSSSTSNCGPLNHCRAFLASGVLLSAIRYFGESGMKSSITTMATFLRGRKS